jgi:hypothetical protein
MLGVGLLGAGALHPSFLSGEFLDTPYWVLALTAGPILTLAGAMTLLFTFQKTEEAAPEVPAHIAFNSRMTISSPISAALATAAASPAAPRPSASRLPAPASQAHQRLGAPKEDMTVLDAQIRDLTRKINKAGVMLATGQLSQQGYLAYVEDLKRQRGKLEVTRVRHELRT